MVDIVNNEMEGRVPLKLFVYVTPWILHLYIAYLRRQLRQAAQLTGAHPSLGGCMEQIGRSDVSLGVIRFTTVAKQHLALDRVSGQCYRQP